MHDPGDGTVQERTETLQVGPSRPPLSEKLPTGWRLTAVIGFVLGAAVGVCAALWWEAEPTSPPFRADEHAVELVLSKTAPPRVDPSRREPETPLRIEGALLMSGGATSTVFGIDTTDRSLDVRVPALPVTVSPTDRFQAVALKVTVRDCTAASRWTPSDRPFTITWRDEFDQEHTDRAGDFGRSVANSLIRYIDAVCE